MDRSFKKAMLMIKKERRFNIHESVSYQSEIATKELSYTEAVTIRSPLKLDGTESFTFFLILKPQV